MSFTCLNRRSAGVLVAGFIAWNSSVAFAQRIRVVDENSNSGVQCTIYREDQNGKSRRAGLTDRNGIFQVADPGRPGERYIARSEEYDPAWTDCPVGNAVIHVHRTVLLTASDHVARAESFATTGALAPAALEFRRASVRVEKQDPQQFKELEYRVAENAAKVLGVQEPFIGTSVGLRYSNDLAETVREYQKERGLKPSGRLNTETLRDLAITCSAKDNSVTQ